MHTNCFRSGKYLFLGALFIFLTMMLAMTGCGKSESASDAKAVSGDTSVDNKPLYGAYSINLTVGSCASQRSSVIIGSDSSKAVDDYYVYLPENQSSYTLSGMAVSRSGTQVTISGTLGTETKSIQIVFNSDFTAGTVTGNISDTNADHCSGTVTGDITLITRTPVEINSKYLQYRSFSNSSANGQAAWAGCTKNSQPVSSSDIKDVCLYKDKIDPSNKVGTGKSPDNFSQGTTYTGAYDKSSGTVNFNANPSQWSGFSIDLLPHQTAGDYILAATIPENGTAKGYTVTSHFYYPKDTASAVVTGLTASWNGAGLVLTWSNPVSPNDDYNSLTVSILKTDNISSEKVLMSINVNKTDGINNITIPNDKMELVKTLAGSTTEFGVLAFRIQSAKLTDQGITYACGYSDNVILPNTNTWKNLDNTIFYGAYSVKRTVGSCPQETASLIIGNDSGKADNDDYLYLPDHALAGGTSKTTVSRTSRSAITVQKTNGTFSENLTITFNAQDLSSATLSGTIVNPDGSCQGAVTGNLTLITRTPVSISSRYISSVIPYSGIGTKYELFASVEKNGVPAAQTDISGIIIKNSGGSTVLSTSDVPSIFQRREFLSGVISSGAVSLTSQTTTIASILSTNFYGTLPAGDYTLYILINDVQGYSVSSVVHIPDYSAAPLVADTNLSAVINPNGTWSTGWTIPAQTDELVVSIIKTNIGMTWKNYLLTMHVNPSSNVVSAVIPKTIVDQIKTMGSTMGGMYALEIQTRKYVDSVTIGSIGYTIVPVQ